MPQLNKKPSTSQNQNLLNCKAEVSSLRVRHSLRLLLKSYTCDLIIKSPSKVVVSLFGM